MEHLVVEPYSTFIAKSDSAGATENENASTTNDESTIAKGRSKRNRRACQLLMADDFINPVGPKWRQQRSDNAKQTAVPQPDNSSPPIKYGVGCLVWARISGHPWWPCMVCNDVDGSHDFTRLSGPRHSRRCTFVEFFGPSVEHAWIADTALIEYQGMEEFKSYAQKQVDEAPSKVIKEKLAERFQLKVALSKRAHWEEAVKEADKVVKLSIKERLKWRKSKLDDIKKKVELPKATPSKKSATMSSVSSSTKRHPSSISFHSEEKKSSVTRRSTTFTKTEPTESMKESPPKPSVAQNSADTMTMRSDSKKTPLKTSETPKRLDSCLYCNTSFTERKSTPSEVAGHLVSCSKGSPNRRLVRCPFCECSFRQPRWNVQRRKAHISNCARKVYGKESRDRTPAKQEAEEPRPRLRVSTRLSSAVTPAQASTPIAKEQSKSFRSATTVANFSTVPTPGQRLKVVPNFGNNTSGAEPAGSVTTTLTTPTTRRLLIKYPPSLFGRRSLQSGSISMLQNIASTPSVNGMSKTTKPSVTLQRRSSTCTPSEALKVKLVAKTPTINEQSSHSEMVSDKTQLKSTSGTPFQRSRTVDSGRVLPVTTPKASLTANELQERVNQRYQALEAVARGTPLADVSLRFQLPRSVIESDFYGDFSSIGDKAVILGRLDLATKDIEEGSRASMAALKYRLPYKYLLMVIRGESQQSAVEQFYSDFDEWRTENLKRSAPDDQSSKTTVDQVIPPKKMPKLALRPHANASPPQVVSKSSGDSPNVNDGSEPPVGSEELHQQHPLYTISDEESTPTSANSSTEGPLPRLSEEDELRIVRAVTAHPDKLRAGQLAISMAKQLSKNGGVAVGKEWWHFMLLKYPAVRHSLLNYYHEKQLEQHKPSPYMLADGPANPVWSPEQLKRPTPFLVSEQLPPPPPPTQQNSEQPVKTESNAAPAVVVRKSARIAKRKN